MSNANESLKSIRSLFGSLAVNVTRSAALRFVDKSAYRSTAEQDLKLLLAFPNDQASLLLKNLQLSKSQFRQDLFVLSELNFSRDGFFVEFGATNGFDDSNTYLLEKEFGWNGILSEPAKVWHRDLEKNRRCVIDPRCVWRTSGSTLQFNEVAVAELSTIKSHSSSDSWARVRKIGVSYDVETISLADLLSFHKAPSRIDYLSMDTEGSEFEILSSFNFEKYSFRCITVEHNHRADRAKIHRLLTENGYVRKYEEISGVDDWYVSKDSM